jgi:hypothetical protein
MLPSIAAKDETRIRPIVDIFACSTPAASDSSSPVQANYTVVGRLHSHPKTFARRVKIPAGTTAYIGVPARPIAKQAADAIGMALGRAPEIAEAHLPMAYVKGQLDPPAQVLVVVLGKNRQKSPGVSGMLRAALPGSFRMNVTEMRPDDSSLPTIRATGTQLNLNRKLQGVIGCS